MDGFRLDELGKVRVLTSDEVKESDLLKTECLAFERKSDAFKDQVKLLIDRLTSLSQIIEGQKLRALSQISKAETVGQRKQEKVASLTRIINEKRAKLEALQSEYASLAKVDAEKTSLLEKISRHQFSTTY